jgi:hypothetical protein
MDLSDEEDVFKLFWQCLIFKLLMNWHGHVQNAVAENRRRIFHHAVLNDLSITKDVDRKHVFRAHLECVSNDERIFFTQQESFLLLWPELQADQLVVVDDRRNQSHRVF